MWITRFPTKESVGGGKNAQSYSAFTETGATQTIKTNQKAELKQKISTFSNPANQVHENNEISTCSLTGHVYATTVSVKCQAQTGSTFMCLRL